VRRHLTSEAGSIDGAVLFVQPSKTFQCGELQAEEEGMRRVESTTSTSTKVFPSDGLQARFFSDKKDDDATTSDVSLNSSNNSRLCMLKLVHRLQCPRAPPNTATKRSSLDWTIIGGWMVSPQRVPPPTVTLGSASLGQVGSA
jgi:hypothetical protein